MHKTNNGDFNTLSIFLSKLKDKSLLSSEEEIEITKARDEARDRYNRNPVPENFKEYRERINKLVEGNYRLVISIARKYISGRMSIEDLIQEGILGLEIGAERFEQRTNIRFSTYATWWIRNTIVRALKNTAHTIRLPTHTYEELNKIEKAREKLGLVEDIPTDQEIAEESGVSLIQIERIKRAQKLINQNAIEYHKDERGREIYIDYREQTPDLSVKITEERDTQKEKLMAALYSLPERQRMILKSRYGILTPEEANEIGRKYGKRPNPHKPYSLRELGGIFGISRERVRQIQNEAINKIRNEKKIQTA